MAPMGVSFEAWGKCRNENCSTIAKIALKKPPKSEVLAYVAGGPKPKRIATFWWLQARLRIAQILEVEMPIGPNSTPTVVRTVPWENRGSKTLEELIDSLIEDWHNAILESL